MWQGVYYYLCYTVLFQFLPVGRPVIKCYDRRYAPLPKPKQGFLIRDDKLHRYRPSSGPPNHHWVEIDVDRAFDIRVREWEIRSAVHNKAAPTLLPDDFLQTPTVYAGNFHFRVYEMLLLPKELNWIAPEVRKRAIEEPCARLCLHFLQGDSGPSVLCEWDLRRVTSRTIYGHRRDLLVARNPPTATTAQWLLLWSW